MNQIKSLVEFIVKLLLMFYNKLEQKRLEKEIKKGKEDLNEVLQKSYESYTNLMDEYDDYLRKSENLRSFAEEVRRDSEDSTSSDTKTGKSDKKSGLIN